MMAGELVKVGLESRLELYGESLVTRARNMLLAQFLEFAELYGFTHLFWLDADVEWKPEAVLRLLLSYHDVCAGVYPHKQLLWPQEGLPQGMTRHQFEDRFTTYPFNPVNNEVDDDGFCEVHVATAGFMCIKRQVFYAMMERYPDLNYLPDGPRGNPRQRFHWRFFDCIQDETNRALPEDYSFCRLWVGAGGKIYADANSMLNHLGHHLYKGDLRENLKRKSAPALSITVQ